jgi:hypothetical protein
LALFGMIIVKIFFQRIFRLFELQLFIFFRVNGNWKVKIPTLFRICNTVVNTCISGKRGGNVELANNKRRANSFRYYLDYDYPIYSYCQQKFYSRIEAGSKSMAKTNVVLRGFFYILLNAWIR